MTTQFYVNPLGGLFDATLPGYDAASSGTPEVDRVFDAFGSRYQGITEAGVVPWSSFSGPTNITPPAGAEAARYWSCEITFSESFDYAPFCVVSYQDPSTGEWASSYSSGVSGSNCYTYAGYTVSTTSLTIWLVLVVYSGSSYSEFSNAAYRVFGI